MYTGTDMAEQDSHTILLLDNENVCYFSEILNIRVSGKSKVKQKRSPLLP